MRKSYKGFLGGCTKEQVRARTAKLPEVGKSYSIPGYIHKVTVRSIQANNNIEIVYKDRGVEKTTTVNALLFEKALSEE